ncbi:Nucleolar complex-associated protein 3 [Yarrowia sp. C11]|nr:Nucleolar complex-associated protein 3 [Yarrowia sp. E02]KAG5369457.1 Nucleolar complex-associated protein 3 [Yarrowia sp. C11]
MVKRSRDVAKFEKRAKARQEQDSQLAQSWQHIKDVSDEDEEDYGPRAFKQEESLGEMLPVRGEDGQIKRVMRKKGDKISKRKLEEEAERLRLEEEQEAQEAAEQAALEAAAKEAAEEEIEDFGDSDFDEDEDEVTGEARFRKAQAEIAELADQLNEDAEENIHCLRKIRELMGRKQSFRVVQLTILSLVPIFQSIIPGYKIRPLTEAEKREKVSKEVKRLRNFETSLLQNYKAYLDYIGKFSRKARGSTEGSMKRVLGDSCVVAACELLKTSAYFNFRSDLVAIVVNRVGQKPYDANYFKALGTIESLFEDDFEGSAVKEIVMSLSKMIRAKKYRIDESLLNSLLKLRLLTELDARASQRHVESQQAPTAKVRKKDRVHLTKKQRKTLKEKKDIDEEMLKAEMAVSTEEREKIQGETLKIVFVLYFNILKERPQHLMAATLEGLAKFSHLINADFFGDLLEVLRELITERQIRYTEDGKQEFLETSTREALLCIVTAFVLLGGQVGESMNLDLTFFINHFYSSLYALGLNPDIELSHKSLRLDDPNSSESANKRTKINVATEMEMVVKSFEGIFLQQKHVSKLRVQAFAKRLATICLQLPEKSCMAGLKILDRLNKKFTVMTALYSSDDRITNGVYRMDVDQPDHANPEASTIWETVLLEKHFSPDIAKAAKLVPRNVKKNKH